MTKKTEAVVPVVIPAAIAETEPQRFVRILLRLPFKPLKDVLDKLEVETTVLIGMLDR